MCAKQLSTIISPLIKHSSEAIHEEQLLNYSVFTSKSVSEGHFDKLADQISDALVRDDRESRITLEAMVKTSMVILAGKVRTSTNVDLE